MGNSMQFPQNSKNKSANDLVNIASAYSSKKITTLTGREICIYICTYIYIKQVKSKSYDPTYKLC